MVDHFFVKFGDPNGIDFLPRDDMLARYMLSSCVSPSVTSQHCTKMAKRRITQSTPYDSAWTLVSDNKDLSKIPTGSPPTGAPKRGGVG